MSAPQAEGSVRWAKGGKKAVLDTYVKLHEGKLGAHWLWCAVGRIAAGEGETEVLSDYGYRYVYEAPRAECSACGWERRRRGGVWRACTEAEARRVTGLMSWEVRVADDLARQRGQELGAAAHSNPAPLRQNANTGFAAAATDTERLDWLARKQDVSWQTYEAHWSGCHGGELRFVIDAALRREARSSQAQSASGSPSREGAQRNEHKDP